MPMITQKLFVQLLLLPMLLFFLTVGIFGVLVGAGLITYQAGTFRFLDLMNGWVSMRRATKPTDIPRDISPKILSFLRRHRRFFAGLMVVVAAYSTFNLTMRVDLAAFSVQSGLKWKVPSDFVFWIANSVWWFLLIGSLAAIAVGIMLEFSPNMLQLIEKFSNHWWTFRRISKRADKMHFSLDQWAAGNPRRAGWIILGISLIEVVYISTLIF